ncbi:MAG: PEP-CTERM sorting domain-containing protein [Phycisphaerales bacterium]
MPTITIGRIPARAALATVAGLTSAVFAQTIRLNPPPVLVGSSSAVLFDSNFQEVNSQPFPPPPPSTPLFMAGQTGGGFVDGAVLVGECGIQIAWEVEDTEAAFSTLTVDINARAWWSPGYHGENYSAVLGNVGQPGNLITIAGPGPMPYSIQTTGAVTPSKIEIYTATSPPVLHTGPTIAPGDYFLKMDDVSVFANAANPSNFYVGTWSLVVPAPGSLALLGIAAVAAARRRR